jgi:hypothetical protein
MDEMPAGLKVAMPPNLSREVGASKRKPAAEESPLSFNDFLLRESSEDMEKRMLDDKFVLGRMAIMGQFTVFYGGPNAGKTLIGLKLLVEAIQAGEIDPALVYYVNADDTYKGIVTKKKLAEQYGFNMLVPGFNGFKADMLVTIMRNMTASNTSSNTIVILDTLKKFTNLMSKDAGSAFGDVQRGYVSTGGTLLGYAHINKAKDDDGKAVHAGTTDIIDDGDCAYILDVVEDDGDMKTVTFRNLKDRGDVAQLASYQYKSKGNNTVMTYEKLFYSVREVGADEAKEAKVRNERGQRLIENQDIIQSAIKHIDRGVKAKTALVDAVYNDTLESKKKIMAALKAHTGTDKHQGHRWTTVKGDGNYPDFVTL